MTNPCEKYRANFLWPPEDGSIEQAGYEFANGLVEEYRQLWWDILKTRIREATIRELAESGRERKEAVATSQDERP